MGSGKSEAVEEFVKAGFTRIYFGDATFLKLKELKLPVTPENEQYARDLLRASGDNGIYARIFLPEIEKAIVKGSVVIESMYSWSEYKIIKERFGEDFSVLCIATDAPLRRERLASRKVRPLTQEQSIARDYSEIENIEKGGPIGIADHYITNNGSLTNFKAKVCQYIDTLTTGKIHTQE